MLVDFAASRTRQAAWSPRLQQSIRFGLVSTPTTNGPAWSRTILSRCRIPFCLARQPCRGQSSPAGATGSEEQPRARSLAADRRQHQPGLRALHSPLASSWTLDLVDTQPEVRRKYTAFSLEPRADESNPAAPLLTPMSAFGASRPLPLRPAKVSCPIT